MWGASAILGYQLLSEELLVNSPLYMFRCMQAVGAPRGQMNPKIHGSENFEDGGKKESQLSTWLSLSALCHRDKHQVDIYSLDRPQSSFPPEKKRGAQEFELDARPMPDTRGDAAGISNFLI